MSGIRFSIPKSMVGGLTDCAYLTGAEDEDMLAELLQQVIQDLSTEILVTVGDVTLHLAAWQDPDHWGDDWRELAGDEDIYTFVASTLTGAIEP